MAQQRSVQVGPGGHRRVEEGFHPGGDARQHRPQRRGQHPEQVQALAADRLQLGVGAFLLGDHPRLVVVDVAVGLVGQRHRQAQHGRRLVALVGGADRAQALDEARVHGGVGQRVREPAVEALVDEARAAAGEVDELAHQVRVHPGHEVRQVQVQVVDAARGLGREVVAQRLRVQPVVQVGAGHDEGAARLGHLRPVHRQVPVDVQARRHAQPGALEHRRPEQAVEVDDVLAQEVVQFRIAARGELRLEIQPLAFAQRLEAGQVADRRVQPHVEELARVAGDLEAEVGRVAGDVPGAQATFAVQPLLQLGLDPGHGHVAPQPFAQELLEVAQLEEEVLGLAQLRRGAGQHRSRFLQVRGRVGGAAVLAVVAVLVGRAAARAGALDVAVGQEHALGRVVELLHRAPGDVAGGVQAAVDRLGHGPVAVRMGRAVVVEGDPEVGEVALVRGLDAGDEVFRRGACLLGGEHDRRAVGVVGAHVPGRAPGHAPGPYPDVGLDVADQVAQVQRAVGVGQGGGDVCGAGHGVGR